MGIGALGRLLLWVSMAALSGCELPYLNLGGETPQSGRSTAARPASTPPSAPALEKPEKHASLPPAHASREESKSTAIPDLIGLDEARIKGLLGQPSESREVPPGKILSYRRNGCSLNLSLFPEVETRLFRTLSYEVTSDDHTDQGNQSCRNSVGTLIGAK